MPLINPEQAYREYVPAGGPFSEHHIKVKQEDLSRYVLIPGSHLRGRLIAERMEECRVVSATRGYYLYTGYYAGQRLTVCSTGMGGPAAAIAMEELGNMGCDTFIRVGSAGAIAPGLGVGDIAIATGSVRGGGTGSRFLPPEFPAVPDFGLTSALAEAARAAGVPVHLGVCTAVDAFYAPDAEARTALLRRAGVLAIEMEADTLFVVAQYRGWRAAAGFVLDGGEAREVGESSSRHMAIADHATHRTFKEGEMALIRLSLGALAAVAARENG
ncbi:MAG TPA: nucleoside phosphorylase [Symbiobacteriaceae bacterium]|nr:nucleoside phosphorylase [Symbiobacteriaceae bacterium]